MITNLKDWRKLKLNESVHDDGIVKDIKLVQPGDTAYDVDKAEYTVLSVNVPNNTISVRHNGTAEVFNDVDYHGDTEDTVFVYENKLNENSTVQLVEDDTVDLNGIYSLVLWKDEDDDGWCVSIVTETMPVEGVCFACENIDENKEVEVCDHGLIQGQYLSEEQKKAITDFGIVIGEKYPNMEAFWSKVKELGAHETSQGTNESGTEKKINESVIFKGNYKRK